MYTANYYLKRNGIKETDVAGFLNAFTLNINFSNSEE